MVKSLDEVLAAVKELLGEAVTSDAGIALIEDLTDTISAQEGDGTDWKAEAERIDKEWREKYTERFFTGRDPEDPEDPEDDEEEEEKVYKFEDLFEEKKEEE